MKFIRARCFAGGPHPTSGLPGFPARDYMAAGGSVVYSPIEGVVPHGQPIGWASTQNPAAGFGGMRVYLKDKQGHEAYLAHFGALRVYSGQVIQIGQPLGTVWNWPNNPGRSHIHMGFEGGDPLFHLVDADGDIITKAGPKPVRMPTLEHVDHARCVGPADEPGKWQVVSPYGKVIFQGKYREAKAFIDERRKALGRR